MTTRKRTRFDTQAFAVATAIALLIFVIGCDNKTSSENGPTSSEASPVVPTPISSTPEVEVYTPNQPVAVSTPAQDVVVTYAVAEAAFNEKHYAEAARLFGSYVDQNSANPWGYYMLGLSQRRIGNSDSAVVSFEKAIELDSLHAKSWINLARANMDLGQPEEALDNIDHAVELSSESNVTLRLQGRAFHQLEQDDDAVAAYRQSIILDRGDVWSMNNLALIYIEQQEYERAIPVLARAVQLDSTVALFHNNLGMALENTDRFRAAEDAYRNALVADATYTKAETNLSRVEHVEGSLEEVEFDLAERADAFEQTVSGWIVDLEAPITDEASEDTTVVTEGSGDVETDVETDIEDNSETEVSEQSEVNAAEVEALPGIPEAKGTIEI